MFTVSKEVEFDAGHRVPFHGSKCKNLHGHRYKVRLIVAAAETFTASPNDPRSGMVLDFGEIKKALMVEVHDRFDHKLILWKGDPMILEGRFREAEEGVEVVDCIPTAEELAQLFYVRLDSYLNEHCPPFQLKKVWITCVEVHETPTSVAMIWP